LFGVPRSGIIPPLVCVEYSAVNEITLYFCFAIYNVFCVKREWHHFKITTVSVIKILLNGTEMKPSDISG
jgi:hypothetical protein